VRPPRAGTAASPGAGRAGNRIRIIAGGMRGIGVLVVALTKSGVGDDIGVTRATKSWSLFCGTVGAQRPRRFALLQRRLGTVFVLAVLLGFLGWSVWFMIRTWNSVEGTMGVHQWIALIHRCEPYDL